MLSIFSKQLSTSIQSTINKSKRKNSFVLISLHQLMISLLFWKGFINPETEVEKVKLQLVERIKAMDLQEPQKREILLR